MSYHSISICFENVESVPRLVNAAIAYANTNYAHIHGIHSIQTADYMVGYSEIILSDAIEVVNKRIEKQSQEIQSAFETATAASNSSNIQWQWSATKGKYFSDYDYYINHALISDLVLMDQPSNPNAREGLLYTMVNDTATPVIVVPNQIATVDNPNKICVAWNHTSESSRAVKDALPMLKKADTVQVISIENETADGLTPAIDIAHYLSQHNVKAVINTQKPSGRKSGEAIVKHAEQHDANLLVMGGYGHSAFHALIFGSATPAVLGKLSMPVLLSH